MYIPLIRPLPTTPVERLVSILDGLCAAIAARGAGGVLTVPLLLLLWGRLRRMARRVSQLAGRIATGARPAARRRARPRPPRPPTLRLPGGFAWVVPLVPGAAAYGGQLQGLLADPVMAPLIADPLLRRLLNPLCQMLGVPKPPKPPPPPPPTPPPSPRPAPASRPPPAPERDSGREPAGRDPAPHVTSDAA